MAHKDAELTTLLPRPRSNSTGKEMWVPAKHSPRQLRRAGRATFAALTPDESSEVKSAIRKALRSKNLTVERLCEEINEHRHLGDRTLWRWLNDDHQLSRSQAYDLVVAAARLGIKINQRLMESIFTEIMPAVIIFDGESTPLANRLVSIVSDSLDLSAEDKARLRVKFLEFLRPYERFNDTYLGQAIAFWLPSVMGKAWRIRMHQIRSATVASDGNSYSVPSLNVLIDQAQRQRRKRSK